MYSKPVTCLPAGLGLCWPWPLRPSCDCFSYEYLHGRRARSQHAHAARPTSLGGPISPLVRQPKEIALRNKSGAFCKREAWRPGELMKQRTARLRLIYLRNLRLWSGLARAGAEANSPRAAIELAVGYFPYVPAKAFRGQ